MCGILHSLYKLEASGLSSFQGGLNRTVTGDGKKADGALGVWRLRFRQTRCMFGSAIYMMSVVQASRGMDRGTVRWDLGRMAGMDVMMSRILVK